MQSYYKSYLIILFKLFAYLILLHILCMKNHIYNKLHFLFFFSLVKFNQFILVLLFFE